MNVLSLARNRLRDTEKLLKIGKFFKTKYGNDILEVGSPGIDSIGQAICQVAPLCIWSFSVEQNPRYDYEMGTHL